MGLHSKILDEDICLFLGTNYMLLFIKELYRLMHKSLSKKKEFQIIIDSISGLLGLYYMIVTDNCSITKFDEYDMSWFGKVPDSAHKALQSAVARLQ